MCVAAPGRVLAIDGDIATIDYASNIVKASKGIVDVQVGDYVLVHAGLILQVISQDEAAQMQSLFAELEDL